MEVQQKLLSEFLIALRHATQRVNFINVLQAAFVRAVPKSTKKTVKLSSFIALFGSVRVKAARRMLVKLTQRHTYAINNGGMCVIDTEVVKIFLAENVAKILDRITIV